MDLEASLMRQRVETVRNVNGGHLEAYRRELIERKLSPSTIHLYLRTVRQFFGFLIEENTVFLNPAELLPNPPPTRRLPAVPTEAEIARIVAHPRTSAPLDVRDRALLETVYGAALRLNELVCMTIDGLHLDEGTARVRGKGDRERVVPLGAEAVRCLVRYVADVRPGLMEQATDRVWIGTRGDPLSYPGVVAIIRTHVRAAGVTIPVSPHSFRRACATHMLRRGASPLLIQQLLGHASLKHLGQYLRVSIRELKTTHATTRPGS
jgi:integrase/recombinase XerD